MTVQSKHAAFRPLTDAETAVVAGGYDEWYNFPEDGSDPALRFGVTTSQEVGLYVQDGTPEEILLFLRTLATELMVQIVLDALNPQDRWGAPMDPTIATGDELALGGFWYDVMTGGSQLTNHEDVRMNYLGDSTWQGTYLGSTFSEARTFVGQDTDGDGHIDTIYRYDHEAGNWWVADSTTNGEPNWRPSEPPRRPGEDGETPRETGD